MIRNARRIAVIGAGVAGLTAARRLAGEGEHVVVFDKGRGPGGRTSTRRADHLQFDHGAPCAIVTTASFAHEMGRLRREGTAAAWAPRRVRFDGKPLREPRGPWYVGTPKMSALARAWARGLDVRCGVRIASLERDGERWTLCDTEGERFEGFDHVLITTPVEQAIELAGSVSRIALGLGRRQHRPNWVAMVAFDGPVPVPFDVGTSDEGALAWAGHDGGKPGRDGSPTWVLRGNHDWTEQGLTRTPDEAARALVEAFAVAADVELPPVTHLRGHLWRYARAVTPAGTPASPVLRVDEELGLLFAGDAFARGGVEGAYLSGLAAADHLRRVRPVVASRSQPSESRLHPNAVEGRRSRRAGA